MHKQCLVYALLVLCSVTVHAAPADDANGAAFLGLDYGVMLGGSDVLDKNISGGNSNTQYIVDAGEAEYLDLHLAGYPWNGPVGLEAAVGYERGGDQPLCLFSSLTANGDPCHYNLQRIVGDLFLRYRLNDVSALAFGRTFHHNIILSSSDDANPFPDVDFRNAGGWTLEYEREFPNTPGAYWGVRYTHIMYHTVNTGASVNASGLGMYVGIGGRP